jgi:hypothetical protein
MVARRPTGPKVDQELRRHKHVTRKLLWMEYKAADPDGLGFSQFKLRLSEWQTLGRGLSMRQVRHAGETVQVDYAGDTVVVVDDGTARAAQIFVDPLLVGGARSLIADRPGGAFGQFLRRIPQLPRQRFGMAGKVLQQHLHSPQIGVHPGAVGQHPQRATEHKPVEPGQSANDSIRVFE